MIWDEIARKVVLVDGVCAGRSARCTKQGFSINGMLATLVSLVEAGTWFLVVCFVSFKIIIKDIKAAIARGNIGSEIAFWIVI